MTGSPRLAALHFPFDNLRLRAVQELMRNPTRRDFLIASSGAIAARIAFAGTPSELCALTLKEAAAGIRAKRISPVDLTDACLDSVKTWNPKINAWVTVMREKALVQAKGLA